MILENNHIPVYYPQGITEAQFILQNSTNFLVYYDPDIDGAVSGDIVRRVLEYYNLPYMRYINENRAHGYKMTDDQLDKLAQNNTTIILVDAAMTEDEIKHITARGVSIINIDHHHIHSTQFFSHHDPNTNKYGVIINNQYPEEPNEMRYLSGGGMVYYVFKALAPEVMNSDTEALVGLSLLSDIRPIENPYAKAFLKVLYSQKSELTQYLINLVKPKMDFGFGEIILDRNFIDYTLSPKINALFRMNKGYEAIDIFRQDYVNTGQLEEYRSIQNEACATIIENLEGEEFSNLTFKFVDINLELPTTETITNFIGLACSQVKGEDKTTILFVKEGDKIKRGSLRGLCDDVNYLGILRKHGFTAEGHPNAFGIISVDFDKVNLQALNEDIKEAEKGYTERKYIDRILDVSNLAFFLQSSDTFIADYNNYVRDPSRIFLRYTGSELNIEGHTRGSAIIYDIDGIEVKCFDPSLHPLRSLILPVLERGKYINFYLKPY